MYSQIYSFNIFLKLLHNMPNLRKSNVWKKKLQFSLQIKGFHNTEQVAEKKRYEILKCIMNTIFSNIFNK